MSEQELNPDPHEVKRDLMAAEAKPLQERGIPCDVDAMDREWAESLERVDKQQKAAASKIQPKRDTSAAEALAKSKGLAYWKSERGRARKQAAVSAAVKGQSPKEYAMHVRLKALFARSIDPGTGKWLYHFPKYQKLVLGVFSAMTTGYGAFRGKTKPERGRIAGRMLEDICDQSKRWLGEWYK